MEKKVQGFQMRTPQKEDWRIKKKEEPDMGSYDPTQSYKIINNNV